MRIVCCGVSARWLGAEAVELACEAGTAGELRAVLADRWPVFGQHGAGTVLAQGTRALVDTDRLDPDQEVALIPPVSGG